MSSSSPATWLISGTTRGIGRQLVEEALKQPQTTIFAGARDTVQADQVLSQLEKGPGSKLIIFKLDSTSDPDHHAIPTLLSKHSIDSLDVVIANAGMGPTYTPTLKSPASDYSDMFAANVIGPIRLFQATEAFLSRSTNPRYFVTGSLIGSADFAANIPPPVASYGISKTAVTWLVRKLHGEFPKLTLVSLHPGLVATEMGQEFANLTGETPITVEESVRGYLHEILTATHETHAGKFINWKGETLPY